MPDRVTRGMTRAITLPVGNAMAGPKRKVGFMRIIFDRGHGSSMGRMLSFHFGPGGGYMRPWWVALIDGPGNATKPNTPCGHAWPRRCNSANCTQRWCRTYVPFINAGATIRVWLGPTYYNWHEFKMTWGYLRSRQRMYRHDSFYRFIMVKIAVIAIVGLAGCGKESPKLQKGGRGFSPIVPVEVSK